MWNSLKFIFILFLSWFISGYCNQHESKRGSNTISLPNSDTIYTISPAQPAFSQAVQITDSFSKKKFVSITVANIINPDLVPITFELYWQSEGKNELLGSVAPFPANNPGSFLIATAGKLRTDGRLELRLGLPPEFKNKNKLEVKIRKLKIE
ncbi:MAG TPA: hypothetical protein VGQ04_03830 [Chitinophagaceae bacterium]|nr:hypothetical protein [Chitinophagaceae bacterium]